MNERIRELEAQCWEYRDGYEGGDGWYTVFNRQKFAELIVRECQFAIVSRMDLPRHERKIYNNVLKEHFGVKE